MTLKELSQLYYLKKEIQLDTERLAELRQKSTSAGAVQLGKSKSRSITSKIERYAEEIADLEAIIRSKQEQCIHERNRLERYIADIPDSLTRQIFKLRFIGGLSWGQVAAKTGNTEDAAKKACYRYIQQKPSK